MDTLVSDELGALLPYHEQAREVDQAVQKALNLIEEYSNDSHDSKTEEAWKHPDEIYKQLDAARQEIQQAWKKLNAATASAGNAQGEGDPGKDRGEDDEDKEGDYANHQQQQQQQQDVLRVAYLDMITDAFADVLEDLRANANKDDPIDVEALVDCLQSGLDLLHQGSKYGTLSERDFEFDNDEGNKSGDELTPHESRRRSLSFQLEESAA